MKITIVINAEVENEQEAKIMANDLVLSDERAIKVNVYDPGQFDFVPEKDIKYSLGFIRHITAGGGIRYGG